MGKAILLWVKPCLMGCAIIERFAMGEVCKSFFGRAKTVLRD